MTDNDMSKDLCDAVEEYLSNTSDEGFIRQYHASVEKSLNSYTESLSIHNNLNYTQGILDEGTVILCNGIPMGIDEVVETLNRYANGQ